MFSTYTQWSIIIVYETDCCWPISDGVELNSSRMKKMKNLKWNAFGHFLDFVRSLRRLRASSISFYQFENGYLLDSQRCEYIIIQDEPTIKPINCTRRVSETSHTFVASWSIRKCENSVKFLSNFKIRAQNFPHSYENATHLTTATRAEDGTHLILFRCAKSRMRCEIGRKSSNKKSSWWSVSDERVKIMRKMFRSQSNSCRVWVGNNTKRKKNKLLNRFLVCGTRWCCCCDYEEVKKWFVVNWNSSSPFNSIQ